MSDSRFITAQTKPNRNGSTQTQSEKIWRSSLPSWLTVGFALILCAAFVACTGGDAKQQAQAASPHAVSVAIAPVTQKDMPVYLVGLGTVTAFYTANIKSRVDGQSMRVNFQEGQTVKEGDLLILIDPRPYQVQLEQMQAQLFKDQATLRDARLNLDRYTTLIPSGSIAQQQVDTQKSLVDQLDGQVRTDQAQIDSAKLEIVYCHITAPFTGRVGLRQVDPGNIVHAADTNPMLILTQLQPIAVIFTLPEDQLPTVSQHMKNSTLQVDAFSRDNQTKLASGKLQTIDNQIDPTTGTAKLKAVFDNKDNQLWPNQFVNANLLLETRKGSTAGPPQAPPARPPASRVAWTARTVRLRGKGRKNRGSASHYSIDHAGERDS